MPDTSSFPQRVGAPYPPAKNLAELFQNRARDARVQETVAKNSRWSDREAFWKGRAEAFEIAADNLARTAPEFPRYVESFCPTTGYRGRYELTEDGKLILPLPA